MAGAAGLGWAVSSGALRMPAAGDILSRAALKSEVAKQVRSGIEEGEREREKERIEQTVAFDFFSWEHFRQGKSVSKESALAVLFAPEGRG